jgi:hypothetical protein
MKFKHLTIAMIISGFLNLPANSQIQKTSSEDFPSFYNKFTTDSLFQISRIIFPLKGCTYYLNNELNEDSLPWIKEKWHFCVANIYKIDTAKYKTKILVQDSNITENIWKDNSGFMMERHFSLIKGKWYQDYFLVSNM